MLFTLLVISQEAIFVQEYSVHARFGRIIWIQFNFKFSPWDTNKSSLLTHWIHAGISGRGRRNIYSLIWCSVLTLASEWLIALKYRHVFNVWHHQREIQRERNVIDDVTMAITRRSRGDHDRRPFSLSLRCDWATLCLCDDLDKIKGIAGVWKLWERFRIWQTLFEHGINSLSFFASVDTIIFPH